MIVGAYENTDFFIYERNRLVAIEAKTPRALELLNASDHALHDGKMIMLGEEEAYTAFDAIDAVGFTTITH